MKNLSVLKTLGVFCCIIGCGLFTGCEKKEQAVELDAATILELEEFERSLDASNAKLNIGSSSGPAMVVNASNDSMQVSPANSNDHEMAVIPEGREVPRFQGQGEIQHTSFTQSASSALDTASETDVRLTRFSTPEFVCGEFLTALATGNHIRANQMLTNVAQIETAKANLQLETPGSEGTSYEVMPALYATSERKVAQVTCILKQPGQVLDVKLTWMMRFQYNGWKISGMSIQMADDASIDLLSFENPKDLARIQNSVADGGDEEMFAPSRTVRKMDDQDSIDR